VGEDVFAENESAVFAIVVVVAAVHIALVVALLAADVVDDDDDDGGGGGDVTAVDLRLNENDDGENDVFYCYCSWCYFFQLQTHLSSSQSFFPRSPIP